MLKVLFGIFTFSLAFPLEVGYDHLNIQVDAKSKGRGGACLADLQNPYAFFSNPAGLLKEEGPSISLAYLPYSAWIQIGKVGYIMPKENMVVGICGWYLNSGRIKKTNEFNEDLGVYAVNFFYLGGSVKRVIDKNLNLGANLKLHFNFIDTKKSIAGSVDLGGIYASLLKNLDVGFAITNLGYEIVPYVEEREFLPLTFGTGLKYQVLSYHILLDFLYPINYGFLVNAGVEISPYDFLKIKGGYSSKGREAHLGYRGEEIFSGFSFGIGIERIKNISLDYAFSYHTYLGSPHRIAIRYTF